MMLRTFLCSDKFHLQLLLGAGLAIAAAAVIVGFAALSLHGTSAAMHYVDPAHWDPYGSTFGLP